MRQPFFYHFWRLILASEIDQEIVFFHSRYSDLLFLIFFVFFSKTVDFGTPFEIRWGQKWHQNLPSGATNLKFLALRSVCLELLKTSCFQDRF